MNACKSCGAEASGIACEFCGAIQRPPSGLQEEIEALSALSKAAQHIAERKGEEPLAPFWQAAWLPNHPDAIVQAASIALGGVAPGMDKSSYQDDLTAALLARAQGALRALELRAPTDPRVSVLRRQVEAVAAAEAAGARNGGLMLVGILVVVLGGFAALAMNL